MYESKLIFEQTTEKIGQSQQAEHNRLPKLSLQYNPKGHSALRKSFKTAAKSK